MKRYRYSFLLLFFLFVIGCVSLSPQRIPISFERPGQCQKFFDRLDEKVEAAGVKDAASLSIPGFPYLRTNRFLSALKKDLKNEAERQEWVRWMQVLDLEARKKEISNLPEKIIYLFTSNEERKPDRKGLFDRVEACSSELLNHDQNRSNFYQTLNPLVIVPDEYSCFMRTMGLYPLIALPVALITDHSREKIRRRFDTGLDDLPLDGRLMAFVHEQEVLLHEKEIEGMIKEAKRNLLGVPLLNGDKEKKLVGSFAPIFIQDVAASYDRLGKVIWKGNRLEIDPEKPTVYYCLSHAFLNGEPILQINYVIWYSERAGERSPSIEKGHLDGMTVRISLDPQGRPFMVDVANDCGCYHFFAPEKERVDQVLSKAFQFDPFVPQWFPTIPSGKRLGVRINSGWHQVQRLLPAGNISDPFPYELVPYDVLEALPHEDGQTESIFDARGIVKGSERVERFILFSMGIPSIGSMRQRGHHAIELIGRAHFDDPYLFEKSFIFK